jgi:hypothetical protein
MIRVVDSQDQEIEFKKFYYGPELLTSHFEISLNNANQYQPDFQSLADTTKQLAQSIKIRPISTLEKESCEHITSLIMGLSYGFIKTDSLSDDMAVALRLLAKLPYQFESKAVTSIHPKHLQYAELTSTLSAFEEMAHLTKPFSAKPFSAKPFSKRGDQLLDIFYSAQQKAVDDSTDPAVQQIALSDMLYTTRRSFSDPKKTQEVLFGKNKDGLMHSRLPPKPERLKTSLLYASLHANKNNLCYYTRILPTITMITHVCGYLEDSEAVRMGFDMLASNEHEKSQSAAVLIQNDRHCQPYL